MKKERVQESVDKFLKVLNPDIPKGSRDLFESILRGQESVCRRDTYFDRNASAMMDFVEGRLAAPHLAYLPKSQDNGVWGDSTTDALTSLAGAYKVPFDGGIDQAVALALVDGGIANPEIFPNTDPSNYTWLKRICTKLHGKQAWVDTPGHMNLVGIRGYILNKGEVKNIENIYNDVIAVAFIHPSTGQEIVKTFVASCDPGRYYYQLRPLNRKGCAHLRTGFWKYQLGRHGRYQYRALVQAAPVSVSRSFRGVYDEGDFSESGWFGINIHAGTRAKYVENASAGCQVIWSSSYRGYEYVQFMKLMTQGHENGQRVIGYNLIDSEKDF